MEARMMSPSTSLKRKVLMAYGAVVALVLLSILLYSLYLSWNRLFRSTAHWRQQSEIQVNRNFSTLPYSFDSRLVLRSGSSL